MLVWGQIGKIIRYCRIPKRGSEIKVLIKNILNAFSEKYWSSCRYKRRLTCSSGSAFALLKKPINKKIVLKKNFDAYLYKTFLR